MHSNWERHLCERRWSRWLKTTLGGCRKVVITDLWPSDTAIRLRGASACTNTAHMSVPISINRVFAQQQQQQPFSHKSDAAAGGAHVTFFCARRWAWSPARQSAVGTCRQTYNCRPQFLNTCANIRLIKDVYIKPRGSLKASLICVKLFLCMDGGSGDCVCSCGAWRAISEAILPLLQLFSTKIKQVVHHVRDAQDGL